jgi:hypothetical protein
MAKSGNNYYGQPAFISGTLPASIIITNSADTPTSTTEAALVDEVRIDSATYDPETQKLSIRASSGDLVVPPELVVLELNKKLNSGEIEASVPLPPASVTVVSSHGGRDTRPVAVAAAKTQATLAAQDDTLMQALPADVASNIDILANDSPNTGVTPRILANPQHGSVQIDPASKQAVYTPTIGFSGPDAFSYINTDANGVDSNVALVSFNVAFLNHPPAANADAASTSVTTPININVLANDTDPDTGDTLNPASLVVTTPPSGGQAIAQSDGTIRFTPAATGQITVHSERQPWRNQQSRHRHGECGSGRFHHHRQGAIPHPWRLENYRHQQHLWSGKYGYYPSWPDSGWPSAWNYCGG